MKYEDITGTADIAQSITFLEGGKTLDMGTYKSQYEVSEKRPIMDKTKRPDKSVKNKAGDIERMEPVNRIPITVQKRIVGSSVSFTFGNPVELTTETNTEAAQTILKAVKRIQSDAKINSHNRRMMRDLTRCTEVAECWFVVDSTAHSGYGFTTDLKVKCQLFSPWNGDNLYPQFDQTGDLVGFARGFTRRENGKDVRYFEVYTDEEKIVWKRSSGTDGGQWEELERTENEVGKIPVIYAKQDAVEWADVQEIINRLEKLMSNFGDTNDYFGSPILTIEGQIEGLSDKNTSGKVFQLAHGAKANFLGWDRAPEAIKLEAELLLRFAYGQSQTPDISFDSVKGLQQISGEALKMLFLDAHLKVQDKREILDEYLQRRVNLLKALVGFIHPELASDAADMEIEPTIVPFSIDNAKDLIDLLSEATGGKPIISQQTAVEKSGLVDDAQKEYEQIQAEQDRANSFSVTEPTM